MNFYNKQQSNFKFKRNISRVNERKSLIAPYLASFFVNRFKPENRCQSRLIKDPNLTKIKDFKINGGKPVTIYSNMLSFKDTN